MDHRREPSGEQRQGAGARHRQRLGVVRPRRRRCDDDESEDERDQGQFPESRRGDGLRRGVGVAPRARGFPRVFSQNLSLPCSGVNLDSSAALPQPLRF